MHPLLAASAGYVQLITWDKGVAHIAGNVNGQTIRRFPVVTEVCAFYQRRFEPVGATGRWACSSGCAANGSGQAPAEPANNACGVPNTATREYLTMDWLWYSAAR